MSDQAIGKAFCGVLAKQILPIHGVFISFTLAACLQAIFKNQIHTMAKWSSQKKSRKLSLCVFSLLFRFIFDARPNAIVRELVRISLCIMFDVLVCERQNKVYFHFENSELWMFTITYRSHRPFAFRLRERRAATHGGQRQQQKQQ